VLKEITVQPQAGAQAQPRQPGPPGTPERRVVAGV